VAVLAGPAWLTPVLAYDSGTGKPGRTIRVGTVLACANPRIPTS
jgi:hypothetical protein